MSPISLSSSVTSKCWFSILNCVCAAGERDATEADPGAGGPDTEPQEYSHLGAVSLQVSLYACRSYCFLG